VSEFVNCFPKKFFADLDLCEQLERSRFVHTILGRNDCIGKALLKRDEMPQSCMTNGERHEDFRKIALQMLMKSGQKGVSQGS